jgi:hypothetical protein
VEVIFQVNAETVYFVMHRLESVLYASEVQTGVPAGSA